MVQDVGTTIRRKLRGERMKSGWPQNFALKSNGRTEEGLVIEHRGGGKGHKPGKRGHSGRYTAINFVTTLRSPRNGTAKSPWEEAQEEARQVAKEIREWQGILSDEQTVNWLRRVAAAKRRMEEK